jgi:hypothetical protein
MASSAISISSLAAFAMLVGRMALLWEIFSGCGA